ncbi:MAG TPA: EamA family transporter, partial [Myxococcaceae bacterium]|nr:EamA family transporter [Myxococcaceae bacterium]
MVDDEVQARKASALAVLSAFAVACTGALTHLLGARFSWQALAVVRTCSVFLGALALSRSRSHLRLLWRASGSLWLRSLAGAGGMLCSFYVWSHLPIADAVTLLNTTPLWVAAVSGLLLKEHTGPGVWLAVVLGMLGVVLVQRPHLEQGNFAVAVALLGGFSGAMAMVGLRRV